MGRRNRSTAIQKTFRAGAGLFAAALISVLAGEVGLRLFYWGGTSFSAHGGPLVERFERDFKFNRFDGPSRGPEAPNQKKPGVVRILVQGDSITWGQGVKREEDLFTTQLLQHLQAARLSVDMAVLSRGGREIDAHLEQLRKWGPELKPDVIIYQWYINDIELDHSTRPPRVDWVWRIDRIHQPLATHSYLYFLLDYSLGVLFAPLVSSSSYTGYMVEHFSAESDAWRDFAAEFRAWSALAKSLTPRVLVAVYPHMILEPGARPRLDSGVEALQDRFKALCKEEGIETIDLFDALQKFRDSRELKASGFDGHPSAAAHRAIAEALQKLLEQVWLR